MKNWVKVLFSLISGLAWAYYQPEDLSIQASKERMQPPAQLTVSGVSISQKAEAVDEPAGQGTYKKFCQVCHASGVAGAPKMGNHDQWLARYKDGWPVLMQRAMKGYKGMPAKGHCVKCTEQQIHEAIEYMLEQSGIHDD